MRRRATRNRPQISCRSDRLASYPPFAPGRRSHTCDASSEPENLFHFFRARLSQPHLDHISGQPQVRTGVFASGLQSGHLRPFGEPGGQILREGIEAAVQLHDPMLADEKPAGPVLTGAHDGITFGSREIGHHAALANMVETPRAGKIEHQACRISAPMLYDLKTPV